MVTWQENTLISQMAIVDRNLKEHKYELLFKPTSKDKILMILTLLVVYFILVPLFHLYLFHRHVLIYLTMIQLSFFGYGYGYTSVFQAMGEHSQIQKKLKKSKYGVVANINFSTFIMTLIYALIYYLVINVSIWAWALVPVILYFFIFDFPLWND